LISEVFDSRHIDFLLPAKKTTAALWSGRRFREKRGTKAAFWTKGGLKMISALRSSAAGGLNEHAK